jgi:TonB-linked SusC/RagA family outer membrane protein
MLASELKRTFTLVSFILFSSILAQAQDSLLVRGVILSHNSEPVPNVSISIEGSFMLPVVTSETGEFSLNASTGNEWLIVSPTGDYKKKRVFLNNRTDLTIYLSNGDISAGDDQLSILSQTVIKRNMTAAYSELNTRDFYHTNVSTVDQYMQGRVPGLYVVNMSGMPGTGAVTTLRGVNSINSSVQPLYIIDGIPLVPPGTFGTNIDGNNFNPLTAVNNFDISKTTIIKDPALTAAYGSKAASGLIVIETLDPSTTQTTIDIDVRSGYSLAPSNLIPQLDATQHKTLMNEVLFSSGIYEENIRKQYSCLFLSKDSDRYIDYQHNTFWQKLIYDNSSLYNINLIVKGGDEIARYGLSFGYLNSKGIIKTTGYNGYNLRFVSRLNIFTWLKMNAGVSLNINSSNLKEAATVKETSPIFASLAKSPLLNPYKYDIEGRRLSTLAEVDELGTSNPMAIIDNYEATNKNYNFISTIGFETALSKNLSLNTRFNLTYNILKEMLFMPYHGMERYYNTEAINVAKATNNSLTSFYNNSFLSYNKALGKNHDLSSITGLRIHTNNYEFDWGLTKNAHENDQYRTIADGQDNLRELGGQNRKWNWLSFYENLNYSFRDKYYLITSISLDGSSRIGNEAINTLKISDVPFGFFYAGGVAWRISNEPFLRNLAWLEDLKLRLTAGRSGNDDIGESSALKYYRAIKFRETTGLYPALMPNNRLSYETVNQIDAGIDLSLLGNRLAITADYFRSVTDNMIIFSPLDPYFGYDFRLENGGKMENRGLELAVFARIIDLGDFKWDIQGSLTTEKNEVLQIKGDKLITNVEGAEIVNMVGQPANSYFGYIFKGVYATQDEANAANLLSDRDIKFQAGDAIYEDISGPQNTPDGRINNYDKVVLGSAAPEYFGGLTNIFYYKRFSFSTTIQFVTGNELYNYVRYKNESMSTLANQSQTVLNRWQYDGQETDIPRALWKDPVGNSYFSTRWIEDGSYLRIKNISLSYKIPNRFLMFNYAEIYVSANNIFVFSKYLGYDPEFAFSYDQITQGIDYGLMPQARQFIAGIKIGL